MTHEHDTAFHSMRRPQAPQLSQDQRSRFNGPPNPPQFKIITLYPSRPPDTTHATARYFYTHRRRFDQNHLKQCHDWHGKPISHYSDECSIPSANPEAVPTQANHIVLILGGGVAGVIAARTLHNQGIDDFLIIEGRDELGGRMMSRKLGNFTVELGANWVQGTQTGSGPANPIFELANKHDVKTQLNDLYGSINDGSAADEDFEALIAAAGERVGQLLVDLSARSGYSLSGARPLTPEQQLSEYYDNNNYTYAVDQGGFSEDNLLLIDQRGFKYLIQAEAKSFLKASQARSSVDFFFLMFIDTNVGWKQEAIQSIVMATYTKIFLRFSEKFWFDTEMGLYADPERGRYGIWQSLDHENFLLGSKIIFVTVTGDFSERVEALPDDQVRDEVLGVLKKMFPHQTLPHLEEFYLQRWHSDPLYRGSYSNWPPSFYTEHLDNLRANVDNLWFGGEATSFKYYGFLHGAYFEGENIASEVAKCIKGGGCIGLEHTEAVTNGHPYLKRSLDDL
ncbi:polyamine oxidase [Moniliophthora roreri]|nr:polyamine oxidase [Moniliophthora roreri]